MGTKRKAWIQVHCSISLAFVSAALRLRIALSWSPHFAFRYELVIARAPRRSLTELCRFKKFHSLMICNVRVQPTLCFYACFNTFVGIETDPRRRIIGRRGCRKVIILGLIQPMIGKMYILGPTRRVCRTCDLLDSIPRWKPDCIVYNFRVSTLGAMMLHSYNIDSACVLYSGTGISGEPFKRYPKVIIYIIL